MPPKIAFPWLLSLTLLVGILHTPTRLLTDHLVARPAPLAGVSAFELIAAMNTLRVSNGLPALVEDPIINAVAQSTADIMASNQMSWHIGDVRGRLASAGYGGGGTVWATENFAVGSQFSIDQIMIVWSDESHMLPAVNPAYCNVGAGVSKSSNGMTYYVLQAAYVSGKSCGEYKSPGGGSTGGGNAGSGVSQLIVPVKIATPDADGKVFHVVEAGQSFWAIAVAYKITIRDLEIWNNTSRETKLLIGQRLFIPGINTIGYATPTPSGMILIATADQAGRIIHTVQAYQTLTTIAQAYHINIETILNLNGIQLDWPLQIGQKLVIHPGSVTPSPTPRPLMPIEKLTPDSDGKYYHTVSSGETLFWIAQFYEVALTDLMDWNGLNESSILRPKQKLILQVTPPATETPVSTPTVPATQTSTLAPPTPTSTLVPSRTITTQPTPVEATTAGGITDWIWVFSLGLIASGVSLMIFLIRKKQP